MANNKATQCIHGAARSAILDGWAVLYACRNLTTHKSGKCWRHRRKARRTQMKRSETTYYV